MRWFAEMRIKRLLAETCAAEYKKQGTHQAVSSLFYVLREADSVVMPPAVGVNREPDDPACKAVCAGMIAFGRAGERMSAPRSADPGSGQGSGLEATEALFTREGSSRNENFSVLPWISRSRTNREQYCATRSLGIWIVVSGGEEKSFRELSS